jgi:hypothetical protein
MPDSTKVKDPRVELEELIKATDTSHAHQIWVAKEYNKRDLHEFLKRIRELLPTQVA